MTTQASERIKAQPKRNGRYFLPGDRVYPAVTEILSVIAKPALVSWAAKVAATLVLEDPDQFDTAEKAAAGIYRARDRAASRGSTIHSAAESIDRGGEVLDDLMPDHLKGYTTAYRLWCAAYQPKTLYTEATIFSDTYQYAGTCDLIALMQDGKTALIDRKTGKRIYSEASLQLAAYQSCEWMLLPPNTEGHREIVPMPRVDVTAVLLLQPDQTYEFKVVKGSLDAFLAAKTLWQWFEGVA